jgi:site-specific recombinase XerD
MSTTDPLDAVAKMAEALGLTPDEVRAASMLMDDGTPPTTVADIYDDVVAACPPKSLPTYKRHFKRLVGTYGHLPLKEVTTADLNKLRDTTIKEVGLAKVARAKATGRPLRSYVPSAHGQGAGENAVRAFRFYFKYALDARLGGLSGSPAATVKVPKRRKPPERPLEERELEEVALAWCCTGNDPELDTLMFEFHRKTACRRIGGLELRLGNLNERRGSVTVTEKNSDPRELPLDVGLIRRLQAFARSRGATLPSDHVFLQRSGRPITNRRYETIYDRIDEHTDWSRELDLGVHWIRHTTIDDVRKVAGLRVASAYAGHTEDSVGTVGIYTKVPFEDLVAAFEAIFGDRGVGQ